LFYLFVDVSFALGSDFGTYYIVTQIHYARPLKGICKLGLYTIYIIKAENITIDGERLNLLFYL